MSIEGNNNGLQTIGQYDIPPIYKLNHAEAVWRNAYPPEYSLMPAYEGSLIAERIKDPDRTATGLKADRKPYEGVWIYQGPEDTCMPCSFMNGSLVLGVRPEIPLISSLLNYANGRNNDNMVGMHFYTLEKFLNLYNHPRLETVTIDPILRAPLHQTPEIVRNNSWAVKRALDQFKVILVSLDYARYLGENQKVYHPANHTVCISGYNIGRPGYMDVQVIDSNFGIFWTTIEHLSNSVNDGDVYAARSLRVIHQNQDLAPMDQIWVWGNSIRI